jgi:teichuronic acid exporter
MNMQQQFMSGLKWMAGAKFGGQIITWGITIIVMRLLSPEDYGLQAMASVFVAFLLMLSEIGLGLALIQKEELDEVKLRQAFGIVLVINTCLLVGLNLFSPAIAHFFGDPRLLPILRALSLQFPLIALSVIPNVLMQRKLRFRDSSLIELSTAIASSLLTLFLAYTNQGVWALIIGSLFGSVWRAVVVNLAAPFFRLPSFSLLGMRELLSFGANASAARLLWFFFNQADVVIVGKLLGKEMLGLYAVAMHLASLPTQRVSSILYQVAFPVLSRFQSDKEKMGAYLLIVARTMSLFSFPLLWGISSTSHEIVILFLGPNWVGAILPLQLLSLMMPLRMLANFLPVATDALGRPDVALMNVLVSSLIMPFAFLIASKWGIVGMAVAWITVYPVLLIFNTQRMLRVINISMSDLLQAIAPAVISSLGMYLMVWTARSLIGEGTSHLVRFLIMIFSGVLTYGGLSLLVNKKGCQEIYGMLHQK